MKIRKFVIVSLFVIFAVIFLSFVLIKVYFNGLVSNSYYYKDDGIKVNARIKNSSIILMKNEDSNFEIKGIRLTSFYPGYENKNSNISKKQVLKWLEYISELNANTVIVPYIQPISFYDAIYEYNLSRDNPIYIIHEISPDLTKAYKNYDLYKDDFKKEFISFITDTIDVVHGNKILLNNKKNHTGIYIKDISNYNLGYIIGPNLSAELISLTNLKNDITSYKGKYFNITDSDSFNSFIAMVFDKISIYEETKYKTRSLLSWVISADTDCFERANESNISNNAIIDLSKINSKYNNIFVSILAQPNDPDFLYMKESSNNIYFSYLKEFTDYYNIPVVISEVGISSSRGKSKVNLSDNYNRGNFSEEEQGKTLLEILDYAKKANISGVFVDSFQDNWNRVSAHNLKNIIDKNSSIYWYDAQSSDQAFGLMAFDYGKENNVCYVDGSDEEWQNIKYLLDNDIKLKVNSDSSYLYLLINAKDFDINNNKIYLGIDINPKLGSNCYDIEKIKLNVNADFILEINGIEDTSLIVQERYDIFSYQYKYYENIISKQDSIPLYNSNIFNSIYMLNRKTLYDKTTGEITNVVYYDTGNLVYGNSNPNLDNFNSLGDFFVKNDIIEIRIPWTLLNVKNPFKKIIQGDFYKEGISSFININNIKFSITKDDYISKEVIYNIPKYDVKKYHERLKQSYYYLQDYWENY